MRVVIGHPRLVCLDTAALKEPCSAGESPESSVCIKKRYILEMKSCSPLGSVDRAFDGFLVLYKVAGTSCELQLITLDSMPPPCKTATLLGVTSKLESHHKNDPTWSWSRNGSLGQSGQFHPVSDGFLMLYKVAGVSCEFKFITCDY